MQARLSAVRRRRAAVLAGAAAAFALGLALGAGHDDGRAPSPPAAATPGTSAPDVRPSAPGAVDRLPVERQVGKLVVLRFAGTQPPAYVRRVLHNGWAAGAILFRANVTDPAQLRTLTAALRRSGRAAGAIPIVCTDQEGGTIRNVPWAPPAAAQSAQRPGPDATAAATALRALGINVTLAPVADVPSAAGAALASRAFAGDAAAATAAAVRGWAAGGVAPTVKHFPGLGGATVNTDDGPATVGAGAPTDADLAPFRAAIAAGVPLVMTSHARYPARDPRRIASQSRVLVNGLLRDELGFEGVVMTDSIEAAAVRATGTTETAAVRSVRAGNDIVLTTGQGSWIRVFRALVAEARASPSFRARVRESAARVLALQRTLE